MLPDTPREVGELEEERAVNILRGFLTNVPDVNIMLNGSILFSSRGPLSFCLGTTDMEMLVKVGHKA